MAAKISKKDQRQLDAMVAKKRGLVIALNCIAAELGATELAMWEVAKKLGNGRKVVRIDHEGTKAKLVFEEDL